MSTTDENYLQKLFINEAKPALNRHSGGSSSGESYYDELWDGVQDYGLRTNYQYGFTFWKSTKITPKYTITSDTLYGIFYGCHNLEELPPFASTNEAGFASAMMAFMNCALLKKVPPFKIKTSGKTYLNNTFNGCKALETIEELAFADGEYEFLDTFKLCNELKNLTIKGTIQSNGLNLQWSTKLSHDSLMSSINALKDYSADTSGTSWVVTLGSENLAKLTTEERLIAEQKGWSLV